MSLLHEVIQADDHSLTALANSHLDIDNPLRLEDKIATVNGIEYAAQAMAVHGSLLSDTPQAGYIASVRNIEIKVPYLPEIKSPETQAPLMIKVEQLMSNENGFTYQFHISCEQQLLISGKITVFLTQA
jgi:predicted hotdog family 3-hydroxylacyl-ACP dehydratase